MKDILSKLSQLNEAWAPADKDGTYIVHKDGKETKRFNSKAKALDYVAKFGGKIKKAEKVEEGETKETSKGRTHTGEYGKKHGKEDVRDQYGHKVGTKDHDAKGKKDEPKKGRGRPKKGSDDSGEVKSYDTKSLSDVFGGGKKPKKEVGKVTKKHSLKEYIEYADAYKEVVNIMESLDHSSIGQDLTKLSRVIQSARTEAQFMAARRYGNLMLNKLMQQQNNSMSLNKGMMANLDLLRDINKDLAVKGKEFGLSNVELEEAGTDQVQIKPASQNTQVIQQGDKTIGTVTNPQLANQMKQAMGQGQMTLNTDDDQNNMNEDGEKWIQGAIKHPGALTKKAHAAHMGTQQFAKAHQHDSGKTGKQARLAMTLNKMHEGEVDEVINKSTPAGEIASDFVHSKNKKFSGDSKQQRIKRAMGAYYGMHPEKSNVEESRNHGASQYDYEEVAKVLAREKPGMDTVKSNDSFYSAIYHELIEMGLTPKAAKFKLNNEDFISDVASAYAHYQANPALDEGDINPMESDSLRPQRPYDTHSKGTGPMATPRGQVASPVTKPDVTPFKTDPIAHATDRAYNFISGLRKPKQFSEGTNMKDIQLESWEKQLNSLLNEGITVSTSTGQQGAPDSVNISATDGDSEKLLQVLRQAGIGIFGGDEKPEIGYGIAQGGEEEPTGTGTEPEMAPEVVGDGDDMLSLIKKLSGMGAEGGEEGSSEDYADEEEPQDGTLEPAHSGEEPQGEEESGEEDEESGEEEQGEESDDEEEQTDEGNAFGQEVNQKKHDNIPDSQQRIKTGGQNLPVKEGEGMCDECGLAEAECECDHSHEEVNEWANNAGGDAEGETEFAKLKALLSMGDDLHKVKRSQSVGNPTQVAFESQVNDWKKLSGIK